MYRGKKGKKGQKGSKKNPETTTNEPPQMPHQQDQSDSEPNQKDEPEMAGTQAFLLHGVFDPQELGQLGLVDVAPYRVQDEIFRYICSWMYTFMWLLIITFVILVFSRHDLPTYDFDETLMKIVLVICLTIFIAAASALLALIEFPGLLNFILKWTGIFNFIIVGISAILILSRTDLFDINLDETFVKIVDWICIIWFISVISAGVALLTIHETLPMKIKLDDFGKFLSIYALIFSCFLLFVVLVIIIFGNNSLGINFDATFYKIMAAIIYTIVIAYIDMICVWDYHNDISIPRFIYNWLKIFVCHLSISAIAALVIASNFVSGMSYETVIKIMLVVIFTSLTAIASALLALKQMHGLQTFILKLVGIFIFFIFGISAILILSRANLLNVNFDEIFVNTVDCICVIWLISIISAVIALNNISNPYELKANLHDFMLFLTLYSFIFCCLLSFVIAVIVIFGKNLLGIIFDEMFFKIVASFLCMVFISLISGVYAWTFQVDRSGEPNWKIALNTMKSFFRIRRPDGKVLVSIPEGN